MVYSSQAISNKALFTSIPDGSAPKVPKVCQDKFYPPHNDAIILSNQNIVIVNNCGDDGYLFKFSRELETLTNISNVINSRYAFMQDFNFLQIDAQYLM